MVGTFPLNVQAGSPQYTLASDITPASSTTTITVTIPNTGSTNPVSNAYYTIQNEDGSKWCTFYVDTWTNVGGFVPADAPVTYYLSCTYTSSNTSDVFPEGSICWCIWCKEYYDSLVTQIGSGIDWSEITGKPSTYPPSLHAATHATDGTDSITPASIGAAAADHTHSGVVQNVTAVYTPSGSYDLVYFDAGTVILPMIPGVTYSGQLRCAGKNSRSATLQFITAGFKVISQATVTGGWTYVTIPEGTCCVVNASPSSDEAYANVVVAYHTVTYQ